MVASGEAVLITGVYGTGKASTCEELAERLEAAGVAYGAIDLDWLGVVQRPRARRRSCATDVPEQPRGRHDQLRRRRCAAPRACRSGALERRARRHARGSPVPAARRAPDPPLDEIERRLSDAVTVGRARDLGNAARWLERGIGADVGDLVIANDGPIRSVADQILQWLQWP